MIHRDAGPLNTGRTKDSPHWRAAECGDAVPRSLVGDDVTCPDCLYLKGTPGWAAARLRAQIDALKAIGWSRRTDFHFPFRVEDIRLVVEFLEASEQRRMAEIARSEADGYDS